MCRKMIEVSTLHGLTIDEVINLSNNSKNKYASLILTIVIMRYNKHSTSEIMRTVGTSKVTVSKHIKMWNKKGIKALEDHRGGSEGTFTAEMQDDLINTVTNKTPHDCGFVSFNWTCDLLVEYIYQNYGVKYSNEWIRRILHKNQISYKRSQQKPTKADEKEQERFKKNVRNTPYFRVHR